MKLSNYQRIGLLILVLLAVPGVSQVAPSWFATTFLESYTFLLVNNNQKTNGTYTQNITFQSTYPGPSLAIALPQLRVVANSSALAFQCKGINLTQSGFQHVLTIAAPTVVWYMMMRYLVFQTLLSTDLQIVYYTKAVTTVINANSGTIRTMNDTTATVNTYTIATGEGLNCLPYLVGFSAQSNVNIQLNLTCTITAAQTITVTATVHPDTTIASLSAYILLFDTTYLAIASYYFVDTAQTTSKYGTQTSFLSLPYGFFDKQFLGGLSSFSTINNYEFNLTLNPSIPYNFTTSTASFYDGVPMFHLRARLCSYPYTFYNKVDGLCYVGCPIGTYPVATYQTCQPCQYSCYTCLNGSTCTSCPNLRQAITGTTTCTCIPYYYEYNNTCYACHYSCQSCVYQGQSFQCLTCDSAAYRSSSPVSGYNNSCPCTSGFQDVGVTTCLQICGDGLVYIDPCDDGNNINGDGCSSTCKVQTYFTCTVNTTTHKSTCTWSTNVTLSVTFIQKQYYSNTVYFYITVAPFNENMYMLTNNSNPCLNSNATNVNSTVYFQSPYLVYKATYSSSMEDTYLRFNLLPLPGSIFYGLPPANVTILVQSTNGLPIQPYTDYQYFIATTFNKCTEIASIIMCISVLLFSFGRFKLMGNELFFTLQMMHLGMLLLPKFTPMLSGLAGTRWIFGYNYALGPYQYWHPKQPILYLLGFSIFYQHNVNVMMGIEGLAIIMYCIYALTYLYNKRKYRGTQTDYHYEYKQTRHGKFLSLFKFQTLMFWTFFNMQQFLVAQLIAIQYIQLNWSLLVVMIINTGLLVLCILPLFIRRDAIKAYTSTLFKNKLGKEEFVMSVGGTLAIFIFITLTVMWTFIVYFCLFLIPIVWLIYLFWRQPFRSLWVASRYVVNNVGLLIVFLFYVVMYFQNRYATLLMPIGIMLVMFIVWLYNIIVFSRELYIWCRYGSEDKYQEMHSERDYEKEKEEENQYFKGKAKERKNHSFLNNIISKNQREKKLIDEKDKTSRNPNDDTARTGRSKSPTLQANSTTSPAKQPELNSDQVRQQQQELRQKRQRWLVEMQEMKDGREVRERTKREMMNEQSKPSLRSSQLSRIRNTGMRGVDTRDAYEHDGRTIRYL